MLHIHCSGTPYEIGHQHGRHAAPHISRTIAFYTANFAATARLTWPQACDLAARFLPALQADFPDYHQEISGIAAGAGRGVLEILAVNVRTEITFGSSFTDGCTSLSWWTGIREEGRDGGAEKGPGWNNGVGEGEGRSWLAQNWDWQTEQRENLVVLSIDQRGNGGKPRIVMVTEAGLIGKIGFNEAGVGVCLNAIRAPGMDPSRLPTHLGLRVVLDSRSREEAVKKLEKVGISSSCHFLIADGETGGVGLEWSSSDVQKCEMDDRGRVFHANHYLKTHDGPTNGGFFKDSPFRTKRIEELADLLGTDSPSWEQIQGIFNDEENYPGAICRATEGESTTATLFNIVMDLTHRQAKVKVGRPVAPKEEFTLSL